ncbi:unnamed protein product [Tilletia controversa]|uniref:Mini-chromosome maintenance complex-binding protein n=3 Tax=Tilletia TaxID=13289 RepID=A0A9N8LVC1_9BASI|nr:hypothetical protein CF335_g1634 [Tilletia laevis]CAD6890909.1 unnamed protein product [Tilletia caries]CAD6906078.1 unnamed protein product [Tilletia controversa]CAD6920912.1 unnamed protein product [Tilletia caries]CAD6927460.1 unnamed protein product [Tilletia controversa]
MVPTQTEFAHALAQPYSVIHSILKRRETIPQSQSEPTDADVVSHFRSLFSNQDRTAKIPALTPEALPALLNNAHNAPQTEARLVRWRCMIQDTGFASEVYQSYQIEDPSSSLSPEGGASQTATAEAQASYSAFGLDFSVPSASDAGKNSEAAAAAGGNKARAQRRRENESLRERNVMYAVSVPGETAWARRAFGDANVVDDAGISVALDALNLAGDSTSSGGGSGSGSLNPFRHKTPIPEEAHVAGLLKFYDVDGASASLQVTQVIEAVGILESTPFRADDWADLGFAMPPNDGTSTAAAGSSTSKTQYHGPCLHVLFFTPLPPSTIPQVLTEARTSSSSAAAAGSESAVSSAPELRAQLVAYLAEALGGDELAAEFLLLTLLARVHTRRNEAGSGSGSTAGGADGAEGLGIGGLSLNLFNVPEREVQQKEKPVSGDKTTATTTTTKAAAAAVIPAAPLPKLSQTLRSLLPAVVDQSLALTHLNSREVSFAPRAGTSSSSDTGETLHAGRLQLTPGTLLLVDEVGMGEGGTLNEGGVRNLQTLSGVLRTRRLEYEYPFNRFAFEADLRCVVLSAGKSFLPVDVFVPLEGAAARVREGEDAKDKEEEEEEEAVAPSLDTLRLFRLFLLQARYGAFTIDERDGVAERISADFVEARKRAANVAAAAKQKGGSEEEATAEAAAVEGMATQEDLLRRMSIARLLALSRSESRLSVETWVRAGELDEARLERIRKLPIGRPAAASGGVGRTGAAVAAKVI